ncbi:MAG: hypothetical protein R2761_00835 [Acidimicrobiales bacterium]
MSTGLAPVWLVAVDSAAWVALSALIGAAANAVPDRWLERETAVTAIRPIEHNGRIYRRRFLIHRWKDRLPEVHGLGPGAGVDKARLSGRAGAKPLLLETRRAEYVHLAVAACGPLFLLWNPPALGVAMVGAGLAFNAPFVMVQRYNRARLLALRAVRSPIGQRQERTP